MKPHASICIRSANRSHSNRSAFTRAELIASLAALFLCAAVLFPALASNSMRSEQLGCLNNLRQIGIAFQAWGNEHDDQRPWLVPANKGGTGGDLGGGQSFANNAFFHFAALSNYISPTLVMDPGEVGRNKRAARTWSFSPQGGFWNANFRDNALSYMLGVHTTVSEAANILTADRNLYFNGVGGCSYGFSQVLRVDLVPQAYRGWTNGNHGTFGNVLLNDGRVEYTSSARLYEILYRPDDFTGSEHFLAPFY